MKVKFCIMIGMMFLISLVPRCAEAADDEKSSSNVKISSPTMPFLPPLTSDFYGGKKDAGSSVGELLSLDEPIEISYDLGEVFYTCGDGQIDPDEQCDDRNRTDNDGCSAQCQYEDSLACGNGKLDAGEGCDDGNQAGNDGCSAVCQLEAVCSDGVVSGSEQCDDGNTTPGDGCSQKCTIEEKEIFPEEDPEILELEPNEPERKKDEEPILEILNRDPPPDFPEKKNEECLLGEEKIVAREIAGKAVFSAAQSSCSGTCTVRIEVDECSGTVQSKTFLTGSSAVTGGTYTKSNGVYNCSTGKATTVNYEYFTETEGGKLSDGDKAVILECIV